jgi:hypothetical protein
VAATATSSPRDAIGRRRELVTLVDSARECVHCGGSAASLAMSLHELEARHWRILDATDENGLAPARDQLQRADEHVCAVVRRGELAAITGLLARTQRRGFGPAARCRRLRDRVSARAVHTTAQPRSRPASRRAATPACQLDTTRGEADLWATSSRQQLASAGRPRARARSASGASAQDP